MQLLREFLLLRKSPLCHGGDDIAGFNLVIAVDSHDLFGDIVHAAHIVAVRRDVYLPILHDKMKAFQNLRHFFGGQTDSEKPIDFFRLKGDGRRRFLFGIKIDHAGNDLAGAQ